MHKKWSEVKSKNGWEVGLNPLADSASQRPGPAINGSWRRARLWKLFLGVNCKLLGRPIHIIVSFQNRLPGSLEALISVMSALLFLGGGSIYDFCILNE